MQMFDSILKKAPSAGNIDESVDIEQNDSYENPS